MTARSLLRGRSSAWVLACASYVVLAGAAIGALAALASAWREVESQRYVELGFTRSVLALLRQRVDAAAVQGAILGGACVLAFGLVWSVPATRRLLSARGLVEALSDPASVARLQLGSLVAFAAALAILWQRGPVSVGEIVLITLLAVLACAAIELLSRRVRARSSDARFEAGFAARLHGLFAALSLCLALGFVVERDRLYHPFATDTWIANGFLLLGASLVFAVVRARALAAVAPTVGAARPAWVQFVGAALLAPLLLPIFLRVASGGVQGAILAAERPLNVLVIGIDTLRADHVDLTGAPDARDRTPQLRRLAQRGTVFTNAISQAPWTMPAFASVLTGKYPMQHGAISLTGKLRDRETTLAEVLREAGYATGGFVSHHFVDRRHGFAQGFDEFDERWAAGHMEITSPHVTDLALDFVGRHASEPFFVFTHYFDPHYEYRPQPDFPFAQGYRGWLKDQLNFDNLRLNRHLLTADDVAYLEDLYDGEIAFTDREIGRLLDGLERRGLLERTVVIVVADHGEEFVEHGSVGHVTSLHEELVRVPLVVVVPDAQRAGAVVPETVETRRVFSTVLEALGLDFGRQTRAPGLLSEPAVSGDPAVAEDGTAGATPQPRPAFSMLWLPDARPEWGQRFKLVSVRTERWKLVLDLTRGVRMLYDLESDPGETRNLAASDVERCEGLARVLDAWLAEMQKHERDLPQTQVADPELRSRMRELGYM